jgi:FlaA1/EpsC-like NDP-sugar epimerase
MTRKVIDILKDNRVPIIIASLAIALAASQMMSFWLRFSIVLEPEQYRNFKHGLLLVLLVKLPIFVMFRLHRGWWSYVGISDVMQTLWVNVVASLGFTLSSWLLLGPSFPRSIYILDFLLSFMIIFMMRMFIQLQREVRTQWGLREVNKRILIYGAGWAGANLARELQLHIELGYRIEGFLDNDPKVIDEGRVIGIPVLGHGDQLQEICDKFSHRGIEIDEILIAMPSATGAQMRAAVAQCQKVGIPCKTLPSLQEILGGKELSLQMRRISLDDLLGRDPVELDETRIRETINGKVVLVTGAAGSIGSELCRQIAPFEPSRLVLLDQAESPLYHIEIEMKKKFPSLDIAAEITDIRQYDRLLAVFARHGVELVYHAAAYKHVPLMEAHVVAAIENNVLGTYNVAHAAREAACEAFVMISSDKAVNPTNVMGATKRAAELVVTSMNHASQSSTRYVSVRFGNVLGSNGSVVPLFQRQIESGGPVTVTHPEVRRFFMLTREAVQLVLQAYTMGHGGEIYVLEMGNPVRIVDLACNMIQLAGLKPNQDIHIQYTGLRPGEKLFEEVITEGEFVMPTHHEKIKIFKGPGIDGEQREELLRRMRGLVSSQDDVALVALLKDLIPEYQVSDGWLARLPRVLGRGSSSQAETAF